MIKILFVCHGNICRSTMAEFYFKYLVQGREDFFVDSAATSRDEIGSPVDMRTRKKLMEHGIPCGTHFGKQVTKEDYENFDLLVIMDQENVRGLKRIIPEDSEGKVHLLLEFADFRANAGADFSADANANTQANLGKICSKYRNPDGSVRDVSDPWYTLDFEKAYQDIKAGCEGLLAVIDENKLEINR